MDPTDALTELAPLDATELAPDTQTAHDGICPRCEQPYLRAALKSPEFKCSCGLELAYPTLGANGEVIGILGWLLSPGTIVRTRYRVVSMLGRGGFGSTYLVEDLKLSNKRWALKEIPESMYDEHESRILAKLNHPSIPGITDREVADGMVHMVLEFGGSRTLDTVRRSLPDKRIPLRQLAPWVRQLCDVLAYMHAQTPPIVHRDLKPGNILLDDQDRVMLIDFGIAKEAIASEQTRALGRAVTHGFSPPEQAMGSGTDARSDVYALAATIYYVLTNLRPPDARERLSGVEFEVPSSVVPGVPPAIDRALLQALSLNPNERQQSVQAFGTAFDYDAPTVKTYDDAEPRERTTLVGSVAGAERTGPTSPRSSLKLGPEGPQVIAAPSATARTSTRSLALMAGVAALVALAVAGTYFVMQRGPDKITATTSVAPITPSPTVPAPVASTPPPPAPLALFAPAAPVVISPAPASAPSGVSAMDELLKRRKASDAEPAPASPPIAAHKPVIHRPKPTPQAVAVTPPAPPSMPPTAPPAPATAVDPAASAWQKANANTQFER